MRGSSQDWGFRQIANVVRVPVETFTESSEIVLWISPQNIVLDAGRGTTILIEYPHEGSLQTHRGAASWVAPVSGTDYTAQSGLTVTGSVVGDRYRIVLANAGSGSLTVSGLQIRGKALVVGDPIYVGASDSASITAFGEREYATTCPAVQRHISEAQEYADGVVARQASPHGWLVARWPGHYDPTKAKNLDISRRVTVERAQEDNGLLYRGYRYRATGRGLRHHGVPTVSGSGRIGSERAGRHVGPDIW